MKSHPSLAFANCRMRISAYRLHLVLVLLLLAGWAFGSAARPADGQASTAGKILLPIIIKKSPNPICGNPVVVGGNIDSNVTWSPSNLYVVDRNIVIKAAGSLTIQPGTVVKFKAGREIDVEGKLVSNGTPEYPVYWTSWADDRTCGDTNADGTASTPKAGDWGWIDFGQGSSTASSVQNSVFRYGGRVGAIGERQFEYSMSAQPLRI